MSIGPLVMEPEPAARTCSLDLKSKFPSGPGVLTWSLDLESGPSAWTRSLDLAPRPGIWAWTNLEVEPRPGVRPGIQPWRLGLEAGVLTLAPDLGTQVQTFRLGVQTYGLDLESWSLNLETCSPDLEYRLCVRT